MIMTLTIIFSSPLSAAKMTELRAAINDSKQYFLVVRKLLIFLNPN